MTQQVHSEKVAVFPRLGPIVGKKYSSSLAADPGESDPWQAFLVLSANRMQRILLFSVLLGMGKNVCFL